MTQLVERPQSEVRVSIVGGDRLCVRCGFNLIGQPVLREPVYGMLLVRCPECATPAALQEYPVLGRWANRWASMLAALWLFVLIGLLAATTGLIGGLGAAATEAGSIRVGATIGDMHEKWLKGLDDATRKALPQWVTAAAQMQGAYTWIDATWWSQQDRKAVRAAAGGSLVDRSVVGAWIGVLIAMCVAGIVWSVALLGAKRTKVALVVLLPVAIASTIALLFYLGDTSRMMPMGVVLARSAASEIVGPYLFAGTMVVAVPGLLLGVWVGRPLARGLVRTLLPPTAASALSILWIAEGKMPPRVSPPPRESR